MKAHELAQQLLNGPDVECYVVNCEIGYYDSDPYYTYDGVGGISDTYIKDGLILGTCYVNRDEIKCELDLAELGRVRYVIPGCGLYDISPQVFYDCGDSAPENYENLVEVCVAHDLDNFIEVWKTMTVKEAVEFLINNKLVDTTDYTYDDFDDLLDQSSVVKVQDVEQIKELVKDVEFDLNKKLED